MEWLEIRRATLADVSFIRRLALESAVYTIPDRRDIANETVVERAAKSLENLEIIIHRRREAAVLVALDRPRERRAGYLILEFNRLEESTGERQAHLYDMAVEQDYMGRFVAHNLVREAARVSHAQGYRYMSATVSASNQRALLSAVKVGFEVERIGLIMACDAGGVAPMPGRPPEQRGHKVDRAKRQSRRRMRREEARP
jgi:ribosomal protein S18 acetylase RimI-like enzyme